MKIALIGAGNMGSALARQIVSKHSLTICNADKEKGQKIAKELGALWAETPAKAAEGADWVILAVKPKDLDAVSSSLSLQKGQTLFSVLAGVQIATLQKAFERATIVRMMPNLALTVGKGIVGFSAESSFSQKKQVDEVFAGLGSLFWILESKMDAFAALAASSPAFGFLIMEAMIEGGVSLGFNSTESRQIVVRVFEGCVEMMKKSLKHPAELKSLITSPGGTTIEGIKALEEGGIRTALFKALDATCQKGERMSKESAQKGK